MFQRTQEFANNAYIDLMNASPLAKAAFIGSTIAVGTHLFGAETLLSNVGTHTLTATESSALSPLAIGAALAGTSAAMETASTLIVSASVGNFPRTSEYMGRHYAKKAGIAEEVDGKNVDPINGNEDECVIESEETDAEPRTSTMKELPLLLTLGSPGYILNEYKKHPENTFKENVRTGARAIRTLATVNFIVGAVFGTVLKYAQDINHSVENFIVKGSIPEHLHSLQPAIGVFPLIKSPIFWWTTLGSTYLFKKNQIGMRIKNTFVKKQGSDNGKNLTISSAHDNMETVL